MKAKRYYSEKYGKEFTMKELSEMSGIKEMTIRNRINMYGWSVDEAAGFVPRVDKRITRYYSEKYGKEFTIKELSEMSGLSRECIRNRIQRGCTVDEAAGFKPYEFRNGINQYYSEKYGKEFTMTELSKMSGMIIHTIRYRLTSGDSVDEAAGFVPRLSQYKTKKKHHRDAIISNIKILAFAYSDDSTNYYECINIETHETFIKSKEEIYKIYEEEHK